MSTFRLISSDVKPLDRAIAQEFAELTPSPTERDLNVARLRMLRQKAEAGLLVTFHWARAKLGDQWLRMNGQHSSRMLTELNGEFPEGLFVHLDDYEVDSLEGLADLFRQFDDRKSGRSTTDVAGAYQGLFPDLAPCPKPIAKLGVDGVTWYRRFVVGTPLGTGDDVYRMFNNQDIHPFLLWLGELFSIKTPELRSAPVVGAMYATWIANTDECKRFWDHVARGGMEFEDNHPTTILDGWLKDAKERKFKEPLKPGQYYQGCIYAWNAYREDKSLKDIRADTRKSWHEPHM